MAFVRGAPQLLVETDLYGGLGYEDRLGRTIALANRALTIPGFAPRLLASLVASSTAACTSGVVTVTAAAHGLPTTTFDGNQFYYPGSPSLAAGWYSGFARTGGDTLTFLSPSTANFTSESVNAGAAFTSEVTVASIDLPANTLKVGDIMSLRVQRSGDAVASAHVFTLKVGTDNVGRSSASIASPNGVFNLAAAMCSDTIMRGVAGLENTPTATAYTRTVDTSIVNTITFAASNSAAGMYQSFGAAKLRIE